MSGSIARITSVSGPVLHARTEGPFLLREAITMAWSREINRLIVQTCTLDHPRALPLYQRFGFSPCGQEEVVLEEID